MTSAALKRLTFLAPPPSPSPQQILPAFWDHYFGKWNIVLPSDYIEFINVYGIGSFYGELTILPPLMPLDIMTFHSRKADTFKMIQCIETGRRWSFWPATDGVLLFGKDANSNTLYWRTGDSPEKWAVSVFAGGYSEEEHYECGMVEFLSGWLNGIITSKILLSPAFYATKHDGPIFVQHT